MVAIEHENSPRQAPSTVPVSRRTFLGAAGAAGAALLGGSLLEPHGMNSGNTGPTKWNFGKVPRSARDSHSGKEVSLVVWESVTTALLHKIMTREFQRQNPQIKIKIVSTNESDTPTKLLTALSANAGLPDLVFVAYDAIAQFASIGGKFLYDWKPTMTSSPYSLDQWWTSPLELATTKTGEILGLPDDQEPMAMFYRRDVLQAAHLPTEPHEVANLISTWPDYMKMGRKLRAAGKYLMMSAYDAFTIVSQAKVNSYFDSSGKPIVNNADYVHAAELAQEIRAAGLDVNPPNLLTYMQQGITSTAGIRGLQGDLVGTWFGASWFEIILDGSAPKTTGLWRVTALPGGARGNNGGSYFVLPAKSAHVNEARKYALFAYASKLGVSANLQSAMYLPAWKPGTAVPQFRQHNPFFGPQEMLPVFEQLASAIPPIRNSQYDSIAQTAVTQALLEVLTAHANPQKALNQAASKIVSQIAA